MRDKSERQLAPKGFIRRFLPLAAILGAILAAPAVAGCGEEAVIITSTTSETVSDTDHERMTISYFKGVTEPGATDWNHLLTDAEALRDDGFNTLSLEPPVLVTERAGGKPRVILEGAVITVTGLIDGLHGEGLAVFLGPTTASPGFSENLTLDDTTLERLTEDVLEWSEIAEERQVELFTPLSRCNLALGTDACRGWMQEILPGVRERYRGPLAAKVAADINEPVAGGQHDFELLDYRGYDYIMIDVHPWGHVYNEERFRAYIEEVLTRAEAVVERDGLKGVIIGDLRLPRNNTEGARLETGTWLNEEQQAEVTGMVLSITMPRTSGFFFYGWSRAGYGAQGYPVEDVLSDYFVVEPRPEGSGEGTASTSTTTGTTEGGGPAAEEGGQNPDPVIVENS